MFNESVIYEVNLEAKPACINELKKILTELADHYRKEKGCITCEVIQSEKSPQSFQIVEVWKTEADHTNHISTTWFKDTVAKCQPHLEAEIDATSWRKVA
ncbi:MAG: hypothetical protein S4CHLAM102_03430 [Chlamydiia bacterium]|nr:hypothetical protein [Chlamydiia bacterium]